MSLPVRPPRRTQAEVFAECTHLLCARGPVALPQALDLLRDALGLTSLVMRETGMHVPEQRRDGTPAAVLEVPVRERGRIRAVLRASSLRPLSSDTARLLGAVADVVALTLATGPAPYVWTAQAVIDAEADRAELAAEVDERLRETLVALRHTDPVHARGAVEAALLAAGGLARELRGTALHGGLRRALRELRATGVRVDVRDPRLDDVAPAVAVVIERVAEAVVRAAGEPCEITATIHHGWVKLRARCADNGIDGFELERWSRRARALGGDLHHRAGDVELDLPATVDDEGRHDNGPHL